MRVRLGGVRPGAVIRGSLAATSIELARQPDLRRPFRDDHDYAFQVVDGEEMDVPLGRPGCYVLVGESWLGTFERELDLAPGGTAELRLGD